MSASSNPRLGDLTRRERQIMNVIYRLERATAAEVVEQLPDQPVNATIRTMLGVLERKGFIQHETVKGRFIYRPVIPAARARRGMLDDLLDTFFRGAEGTAAIAILKKSRARLSDQDREEILKLIGRSRRQKK